MVAFGRLDQQASTGITGEGEPSSSFELISSDIAQHDHAFVARARAFFEDPTDQGISQYIRRSNQRMLQGKYKQIFNKVTTSNNNKWLRRKLLEATGLYEEAETVGTSAGKKREHRVTNSASSRQPGKRSKSPLIGKREATTAQSGQTNPAPEVTEGEARTSRQLKRPVKPKRVDHLPTGKEALSGRPKYGEEIVGRRVCIYWEQEGQFFAGEVSNFHSRRGQHKIDYDDGDVEHVVLDQESFFFEDDPQEQMDNTLLSQKRLQDRHTLSVNDVVWVRARGHGFWPGQIKAIFPDHGSVGSARVKLFEGSETEVSMRDIADFEEHFDSLSQAKTNASFIDAVKARFSSPSWPFSRRLQLPPSISYD